MKQRFLLKSMLLLFALIVGSGNVWATDFTLSSANSVTIDGITVSFAKGSGSTAPTWYDAGLRLYASNTITITSSNAITGISFDWEKQGNKTFASVTANTGSYSHPNSTGTGTWETGGDPVYSVTFTVGSSGQLQLNTFSVTTSSGGSNLTASDLAITGAPVALNFDLYNNSSSQTVSYTTSSTGAVSIANNSYATFSIDQANKTITVTPTAVTNTQTITVNQQADARYAAGSATFTISISDSRPVIKADNVDIDYDATSGEIAYTVSNSSGATLGASSTTDWIRNIAVTSNKVTFTTTANEGNSYRTGTITLTYANAQDKVITVTQWCSGSEYAKLPFSFNGGKGDMDNSQNKKINGLTQSGLGNDYTNSPKLKFDHANDYVILRINEAPGTLTFDIKGNPSGTPSGWDAVFKVQTSKNGTDWADFKSYDNLTTDVLHESINTLDEDIRYIKWTFGSRTKGNVALGNISLAVRTGEAAIGVANTAINVSDEITEGTVDVTCVNMGASPVLDIVYCDAEGNVLNENPYESWFTASINAQNKISYIIDGNSGTTRKAYFKVYGLDNDWNYIYSDLITVTQSSGIKINYTLASSITPGKKYVIASGTSGAVKVMGAQNPNNRVGANGSVSGTTLTVTDDAGAVELTIYGPDASEYYTIYDAAYNENAGGYLYASSSENNYLNSQATNDMNGKWSISIDGTSKAATVIAQGSNTNKYMRFNNLFSCYGENSTIKAPVYFYEKADAAVATTVSKTLNGSGYATFATTNALDFLDADDASFSAWQITGVSGTTITFSQIKNHVEAGTGILLKGTPNAAINLNILPVGGEDIRSTNKLVGTIADFEIEHDGDYYGLSGNTFKKIAAGTVPAGKALLSKNVVGNAPSLTFSFEDGETTSMSLTPTLSEGEGIWYDLSGRKLQSKPTAKGIYIMNGKKVIIK